MKSALMKAAGSIWLMWEALTDLTGLKGFKMLGSDGQIALHYPAIKEEWQSTLDEKKACYG